MKRKKILSTIIAITLLVGIGVTTSVLRVDAATNVIDKNINKIMEAIDKMPVTNPGLASSSNPYDYMKNNTEFDNIVNIGSKALPILKKKVDESSENGLREYILAATAEKIAKVNLKGESFGWANGKEWSIEWDNHLKSLPGNFKKIVDSSNDLAWKNSEIIKLGTPAIPLILDNIEKGDTSTIPALEKLLEGNATVKFDKGSINDYKEWAKTNKANFEDLRNLINSAN